MRRKAIFIAATGQNVGKTTICLGLVGGLKKKFPSLGFMKPLGQQYVKMQQDLLVDKDVVLFKEYFSLSDSYENMSPIIFSTGFTRDFLDGKYDEISLRKKISTSFEEIYHSNDFTIVEGTGHVGVGSTVNLNNADVASLFDLEAVMIAKGGIGSALDELALNKACLEKKGVKIRGVILNKVLEEKIRLQARLSNERIKTVATGVDPKKLLIDPIHVQAFRKRYGIEEEDCLVGTLCVIRGWKGISDLLHAAKELKNVPRLKWIVVGGGVSEAHFLEERKALGLEEHVVFTGHLDHPYVALAALDIFLLLSWAHEGISQSALQASFLEKPLVTTPVGGLGEVCLDRVTGLLVEPCAPRKVAEAVLKLYAHPHLRSLFGAAGKKHVESNFTFEKTLNEMEEFYCKGKKI